MINKMGRRAKLSLLLALAILSTFVLSSCAGIVLPSSKKEVVTIDDFMVKQENQSGAGQTITSLSGMIGIPQKISGDVIVTVEETDDIPIVRVYNLLTGNLLRTVDDGCTVGFVGDYLEKPENAAGIFYVIHHNILYICNSDGSEAVSAFYGSETEEGLLVEEDPEAPAVTPVFTDSLNGFAFNGIEYYVRDGVVVYEGFQPLESDYFNASVAYKDYHYYIEEDLVFVFEENGTLVYEYTIPSYADASFINVLSDGNVFIQYRYPVIADEDYDFVLAGQKYKLVSVLANIAKKTETLPVMSLIVAELHNAFTDEHFHDRYTQKVSNLARVREIRNKRIDENQSERYSVLSNNLIELYSLDDMVSGAQSIVRVSYDRNLVVTSAGAMLVSGDGTIIGQLNNYRCITEKYIVTSGAVYDHNLKKIYDLTENGFTFHNTVGDNILFSKVVDGTAGLYLYADKEPTFISQASGFEICFEGYLVKEADLVRYYDENGLEIASSEGKISWIYDEERDGKTTHVGYYTDVNGNVKYYSLRYSAVSIVQ